VADDGFVGNDPMRYKCLKNYHIRWFDPRSGVWVNGGMIKGGSHTLEAPAQQDWVLLIRKKAL